MTMTSPIALKNQKYSYFYSLSKHNLKPELPVYSRLLNIHIFLVKPILTTANLLRECL
jgi:hypothetical protein